MNVATTCKLISDADRTNDAVFLIDLQSRAFRYVNDSACQKLGYSRDELLQMEILDIDPFMDEASLQKITEQIKTQGFYLLESCHRTKDGRLFPVEVSGHLFEYNGEWVALSIARDITERKQKDNQLTLLDYAFDNVEEAIFLIDENARFIQVNEKACSSLGYTREELLTLHIFDIDPDFKSEHWEQYKAARLLGSPHKTIETRHKTKDGRIFPVEVRGTYFTQQGKNYNLSLVRDISEHKATDRERRLLNYALDHVQESVWLIGHNAKIHYINQKACHETGLAREKLLTLTIPDVDPTFPPERWSEHWQNLQAKGAITLESNLKTKDGQISPIEVNASYFEFDGESYNLAFVRDITERKATEKKLALFSYALDHIKEEVWLIDENAKLHYVNQETCRSMGFSYEEMLELSIPDINPDCTAEVWDAHWQDIKTNGSIWFESIHQSKNGENFPVEVRSNYFEFDGKSYSLALSHDISERKETEKQLALLNYALDHVGEAAWLIDENTKFHYNNAEACRAVGYTREEMLQLGVPDIAPLYQLEFWPEHWQNLKANGSLTFESLHQTKDGHIFPVEINANYFEFDGKGYNLALIRDITERKETEKQLALLNYALDHVGESAWLLDENAQIHYVNDQACREVGLTREELLSLSIPDIDPDYQWENWNAHWQDLEVSGSILFETVHKSKEGVIFPVQVNSTRFEFDGKEYILSFSHDITERKKDQEALQHSEALLTEAQRIAHIGSWEVDIVHNQLFWSDETYRLWEIDKSQFAATIEAFYETVHPEDREKVAKAYNESIEFKTPYQVEHRLLFPDGRVKHISERGEVFYDENGNAIRFVGTSLDITERHHIDETLKFVAQRGWKNSNESFLVALAQYLAQIFGVDYVIIDKLESISRQAETVALYVKGGIVPNMQYDLKGTPCDGVMNGKLCAHPRNVQQLFPDDLLLVEMQVESYAGLPLWNTNGDVIGLIAVMDTKPMNELSFVTSILQLVATSVAAELERQRSEQVLFDAHHFLKQIVNTLADPVFVKDRQHRWVLLNQALCDYIGYTLEDLLGKSDYDFFPKEQADVFWAKDELVFSTGEENINEETFTNSDGFVRTVLTKKTCYTDSNGQQFLVGIVTDITERKRMEDELAAREQQFRVLAETLPSPVFRFDKNCRRIYMNPMAEKIAKIPAEELLYKKASDVSPLNKEELQKVEQTIQRVLDTGKSQEGDVLFKVPSTEQIYYFHNNYAPEFDANGDVASVIVVSHDITERKKMEDIIRLREQEFRVLVETSPAPIIRYDANCRRVYVNPAVEKISGKTAAELIDHAPVEGTLLDKPVKSKVERILRHVLKTGRIAAGEVELVFPDGRTHYFYNRYAPEINADGKPVGVVLIGHDITAHKYAEKLLVQREREFRTLAENTHNLIVRYDRECRRTYVNPAYAREMPDSLNKTPRQAWVAVNTTPSKYISTLHRIMESGVSEDILLEWPKNDDQLASHIFTITPEFDTKGLVTGVLAIGHDITELKRGELRLQQREREFRSLAENIPDCVTRYDVEGRVTYMNPAMLSSLAPAVLPIIGETLIQSHPDNEAVIQLHQLIEQIIKTGNAAEIEIALPHFGGEIRTHLIRCVAEYDLNGTLIGVLAIGNDITERKQMEQQMFYHASYDSLTGLPNRRMLNNRIREEIAKADRSLYSIAVLFVDLDRFKEVNDTLGHEIGDCLLVEAAQRIRNCIRTSDTVARLGGDEFVVILSSVGDVPPLERVTQSILVALAQPFYFGYEYSAYISASIGIAVYPQDANDAESLIGCADQAMYAAKESGRNNFSFFTASMQEQAQQRLRLIGCLREALDKNQFEVYYQPITCIVSGKPIKAEALVRWHHPVLGMVSPALFIPLAEETDLIQDIGSWVFRQAADTAKRWNELSGDDENRLISINMSPRQLTKGTGDQIAINYLQEIGLDSASIVVEITEGLLLDDSPDIIEKLERLRMAGIKISLDDFGTGYSAMAYLKKFNLDYLKIDQSFVRGMETDLGDHAITEAIIMMAHRLGLKVIAEGVETEGQRKLLAEAGCEYIQGYFYSKPLPIDAFLSYVMR